MTYTPEQRRIIALSRRLSRGYGRRVQKSLYEAERVESSFRNLSYGDRDSQGVLQQRPSTGWGPPGNAAQDIRQYLAKAQALVQRGFRGTAGQLAQAVQGSAFPGRYDQHASEAAALLGGAGAGGSALPPQAGGTASAAVTGPQQRSAFARALADPRTLHDPLRLLTAIKAVRKAPAAAAPGGGKGAVTPSGGGPKLSGNGSTLSQLEPLAHEYGLTITSTTGGKHVANSYHYQGRAVDYAGDPARMASLMRYALAHPHQFKEAFYDPVGMYVKNGKVYRGSIGGHNDHVHLAR